MIRKAIRRADHHNLQEPDLAGCHTRSVVSADGLAEMAAERC
jgi:hypothetical protein